MYDSQNNYSDTEIKERSIDSVTPLIKSLEKCKLIHSDRKRTESSQKEVTEKNKKTKSKVHEEISWHYRYVHYVDRDGGFRV